MVNKIIADYLKTNKRLVVPQFGAFLHKDDGTVAFVPFLKKDDGVLIQLIGSAYGLNPGDAQAAIEEFTAEIKKNIAARGAYIIEGIGTLKIDSNSIYYLDSGQKAAQAIPAPLRLPPHPYPRLWQQHGNSARRLRPSLRSKNRNRPSRRSRRQSNGRLPRRNLNPASRPDGPCRSRRNNVPYNNRRRRIRAIRFGRRRRRSKFPTALRNSHINRRCRTQATGLR